MMLKNQIMKLFEDIERINMMILFKEKEIKEK